MTKLTPEQEAIAERLVNWLKPDAIDRAIYKDAVRDAIARALEPLQKRIVELEDTLAFVRTDANASRLALQAQRLISADTHYHECAIELGVPIGQSIADKILPGIKRLKAQLQAQSEEWKPVTSAYEGGSAHPKPSEDTARLIQCPNCGWPGTKEPRSIQDIMKTNFDRQE